MKKTSSRRTNAKRARTKINRWWGNSAPPRRLAVVGIGSELNGDDAAGVLVARGLLARQKATAKPLADPSGQAPALDLLVIDAGPAPEAFTGPLRRFQPDWVLLVDAAVLDEAPGTVRWLNWGEVDGGMSASTHTLPPTVLVEFLNHELGCRVMLVGIQPKTLEFDVAVSAEVQEAVERLTDELISLVLYV